MGMGGHRSLLLGGAALVFCLIVLLPSLTEDLPAPIPPPPPRSPVPAPVAPIGEATPPPQGNGSLANNMTVGREGAGEAPKGKGFVFGSELPTGKSQVTTGTWSSVFTNACIGAKGDKERFLYLQGRSAPKGGLKDSTPPDLFSFGRLRGGGGERRVAWSPGPAYYLPDSYNIAHDLGDNLPVMFDMLTRQVPEGGEPVTIVVHPRLRRDSWLYSIVSLIAPQSTTILHDPTPSGADLVCFKRLTLCGKDRHFRSHGTLLHRIRMATLGALSIPTGWPRPKDDKLRVLLYTRSLEVRRQVLNAQELERAVVAGMEGDPNTELRVVHGSPGSFEDQVRLYGATDILVGVSGGSQSNTVFMHHSTASIVELLPCDPQGVSWLHFLDLWSEKRGTHLPIKNCPSEQPGGQCVEKFGRAKCEKTRNFNFAVPEANLKRIVAFLRQRLATLRAKLPVQRPTGPSSNG